MIPIYSLRDRNFFKGLIDYREAGSETPNNRGLRCQGEEMLREIAYVLSLTQSIKDSIDPLIKKRS